MKVYIRKSKPLMLSGKYCLTLGISLRRRSLLTWLWYLDPTEYYIFSRQSYSGSTCGKGKVVT